MEKEFLSLTVLLLHTVIQITIAEENKDNFLLNGYSKLIKSYRNDTTKTSSTAYEWGTRRRIESISRLIKEQRFSDLAYRGVGGMLRLFVNNSNMSSMLLVWYSLIMKAP